MATFTEDSVTIELTIAKHALGNDEPTPDTHVIVTATTLAGGTALRAMSVDITSKLSAARMSGIADLLADIEAKVKAQLGIA